MYLRSSPSPAEFRFEDSTFTLLVGLALLGSWALLRLKEYHNALFSQPVKLELWSIWITATNLVSRVKIEFFQSIHLLYKKLQAWSRNFFFFTLKRPASVGNIPPKSTFLQKTKAFLLQNCIAEGIRDSIESSRRPKQKLHIMISPRSHL